MTNVTEIAPDLFRLSIYVPELDLQFNHFLVRDEQPLLFHAGLKGMYPLLRDAVATLMDPGKLRYVAWSHFESDEIGGLNHWLEAAPEAEPVCTFVGKVVSVDDYAIRPARGLMPEDVLETGTYRFRFFPSPHLPHGWDAGLLFEETRKTLFCSDLFHHFGDVLPVVSHDLIGPALAGMRQMQQGPLAGYLPYTPQTQGLLAGCAQLQPETLAVMHGSSYTGKSGPMLKDLANAMQDVFAVA
ncbi:MBL fold metallo-hydrolase [Synechococcus sp. BA-132 BA5]|uniref:MBL fold metallo-hydrolase n=1 Tax=Synechococcus sp. BA-132 BA5 TaxID=3110252 RepID=UPI002B20F1FD|nr:MBL fold metallo-hydrolase [Synechococcus sp. BA-132 BA5]MEA5414967.1 MBL fold metallo-hydrolase [Synechococcus sp. BA-132 BA5]